MRTRRWILLGLVAVATGCQHGPYTRAHLDLINAEKRALEDDLYELKFDYESAQHEIEQLKAQIARLRGSPESVRDTPRDTPSDTRRGSSQTKDSDPSLTPPTVDPGSLVDPKIELPPEIESRGLPMPKTDSTPSNRPPSPPIIPSRTPMTSNGRKSSKTSEVSSRTLSLDPADPRVTQIVLNQLLTGGSDFDRQPGDDGIVVVVEPRNQDNTFVPLAGPITVVVLDPTKTAEQGRIIARWDVDANLAQQSLRNTPNVRGIELRLPWPAAQPQTGRLHVHVRYLTLDNRDLRADRPLFITLPGQVTQQWTPRAATRYPLTGSPEDKSAELSAAKPTSIKEAQEPSAAESLTVATDPPSSAQHVTPPVTARPEWRPQR